MRIPGHFMQMPSNIKTTRIVIRKLPFVSPLVYSQVCSLSLPQMTQLICVGGSAGCDYGIQPHVIQCHNQGFDGYNMQVKGMSL